MSEFRSGYGQAKADALERVKEAMSTVDLALNDHWYVNELTEEKVRELKAKQSALRWIRSCLKGLNPPR